MISFWVLNIVVAILILPAANAAGICESLGEVSAKVKSCGANQVFVRAGQDCLQRMDGIAKAQKAVVSALLASDVSGAGLAQSSDFGANLSGLGKTIASLKSLRANAESAKVSMMSYSMAFIYPGGTSQKAADQMGLTSYFNKFPCFTDPLLDLNDQLKEMDQRIADLDRAIAQAEGLAARTGISRDMLDANLGTPDRRPAGQAYGAGAPAPRTNSGRGPQKLGGSDISGSEKLNKPVEKKK